MTAPSDSPAAGDPHEGIDPSDNPEARAAERDQTPSLSRASAGGPPPRDAPRAGELPEPPGLSGGTSGGDPTAGVHIDDDVETVAGDEGPEHPGVRRSH